MRTPAFSILLFLLISCANQSRPTINWISIPAGTFKMGSPLLEKNRNESEIQHQVTLHAFKLSKYEITFDQYDMFCEATARTKPKDEGWGRGNRPVINISWNDANAFALWMGCRLPTEAEWEYACRAGTSTSFNTGVNLTTLQANFDTRYTENCNPEKFLIKRQTKPVGSFPANSFGLYDMHGNVGEWCSDWSGDYPKSAQYNPKGPASGEYRVIRGGGWHGSEIYCRSAYRNAYYLDHGLPYWGFRLASDN